MLAATRGSGDTTMKQGILIGSEALAITLLGLMSGFFFAFAIDVVPAMTHLDASQYVTTQQWINKVVRNATFGAAYFGSTVIPFVVAAIAFVQGRRSTALAWFVIAAVYFGAVFWITRTVNIPINNELATWNAASPPADWLRARDRWNDSNAVRAAAAALCFFAAVVLALARPKAGDQAGLSTSMN